MATNTKLNTDPSNRTRVLSPNTLGRARVADQVWIWTTADGSVSIRYRAEYNRGLQGQSWPQTLSDFMACCLSRFAAGQVVDMINEDSGC